MRSRRKNYFEDYLNFSADNVAKLSQLGKGEGGRAQNEGRKEF